MTPPQQGPYDLFLSYATDDDSQLAQAWGGQQRWVRCLRISLEEAILRSLRRDAKPVIFMDRGDLRVGDDLDRKIEAALGETHLLLALASARSFREGSWCRKERSYFIGRLGSSPYQTGRVLPLLLDAEFLVRWREEHPGGDPLALHFFEFDPIARRSRRFGDTSIDKAFLDEVSKLGADIAKRIDEKHQAPAAPAAGHPPRKGKIVLAAMPLELMKERRRLARLLEEGGWELAPMPMLAPMVRDKTPAEIREAGQQLYDHLRRELPDAVAFVQLLSASPWTPADYDHWQHQAAVDAGSPCFRYRLDTVDLGKVADESHRAWLQQEVLPRSLLGIESQLPPLLELALMERHLKESAGNSHSGVVISLYADHEADDDETAQTLAESIRAAGVFVREKPNPVWFEGCVREEHGLLIVHEPQTPLPWLIEALSHWRELLIKYQFDASFAPPCGVFLAGAEPEARMQKIKIEAPGVKTLASEGELASFLAAVQDYAAARKARRSARTAAASETTSPPGPPAGEETA